MTDDPQAQVPVWVRAEFGHAVVQHLADLVGADILHLKGAATDVELRTRPEGGSDADVLVRPAHLDALLGALWAHGWTRYSGFETGSAFEHATTAQHPDFLYADLHRYNPGFDADPGLAFSVLWQAREPRQIAGMPCAVPDRAGRVLVHVLNQARSRQRRWTREQVAALLPDTDLAPFDTLVDRLQAQVGYAAALGELDRHRGARTYALWRSTVTGGSRVQEWLARVRAAESWSAKARIVGRAPLVNIDHLGHRLGHRPSRREVAREFVARPARGLREEWAKLTRRAEQPR